MRSHRASRRVFAITGPRIVALEARDVRFPTSRGLDGSDAMHPDPDYSAAYVVLRTDVPGLEGHGLTFTIGRGTEICVVAARAFEPMVVGQTLGAIRADMRGLLADARRRQPPPVARAGEGGRSTSRPRRSSTRSGISGRSRGQAALEAPRRSPARGARREHRLPLHRGRAHAEEALELLRARRRQARSASRSCRAAVSRVHDVGRLARLRRREGRGARPQARRRRVHAREDEGRAGPRRGRAAGRA